MIPAVDMPPLQSCTVETNLHVHYKRQMFDTALTNPRVELRHPNGQDETDPMVTQHFLQLIDREIGDHPDLLIPADEAQIARLKALLKDVEV